MNETDAIFIRVRIEENDDLFLATSPDMESLFVAEQDMRSLIDEIPEVIKALLKSEREHDFNVWKTRLPDTSERAWVAIPAHVASEAMTQVAAG